VSTDPARSIIRQKIFVDQSGGRSPIEQQCAETLKAVAFACEKRLLLLFAPQLCIGKMAHPGLTPLPPTIHHSSTPISHRAAHTILSSFLSLAELDPSLRPDSVLSERGPTSSSTPANPNLTLTHLGRIKLGIEGKRVGGGTAEYAQNDNLDFWGTGSSDGGAKRKREFDDGEETPRNGKKARDSSTQDVRTVEDGRDAGQPAFVSTSTAQGADEWQDRENYDLAQDDDEVDVGKTQRNAGAGVEEVEEMVGMEDPDGEIVDVRGAEVRQRDEEERASNNREDIVHRSGGGKVDKAERKRLKKEKSKKEKKTARPR
jgi:hypothetical protein